MMLRRHMLQHQEVIPLGNYIYRILNVPTTAVDTGIKLVDTNKAYTILTEMSFPNSVISGNNWNPGSNSAIYGVNQLSTSGNNPCTMLIYSNYMRIRFFDKQAYNYANVNTAPFLSSTGKHRFVHWHEENALVASINLDGYITKTTPTNGAYATSNDTLLVKSTDKLIVHHIYIYDYVLTQQEMDDYISNGTIP